MKILFILKKRKSSGGEGNYSSPSFFSSGLFNSANFINEMLQSKGVQSHIVEVVDNNFIDREVYLHKPDIVIIEALWVVPEKFEVLKKLHPKVKWVVRLHSHIPFIANEGEAIEWIKKYNEIDNVYVSSNYHLFIEGMNPLLSKKIIYLPNYYPVD